jgi:hypothetical protein
VDPRSKLRPRAPRCRPRAKAGIRAREAIADDVPVGANPNFLSASASAHLLLGEAEAARPAIDRLAAMGYHTPDLATMLTAMDMAHLVTPAERRCGTGDLESPAAGRIR